LILGHSIALDATEAQQAQFRRACDVARYAWNWAHAKWQEMHKAGEKPSAHKIKVLWNAHRKAELPWTFEVSKCVSGQAVMDLGAAYANFFRDLKKPKGGRKSRFPRFKSKRNDNGFALWNDQFQIDGDRIRIPRVGWVKMHEPLRFQGKIMGARVSRIGTRWHVSVQVETVRALEPAPDAAVGIDLGITTLMQLSRPLPDGRTQIANPRARRSLMKRQAKIARRISRQELQRRKTNAKTSKRQMVRRDRLRKLHYRIACIRKDAIHKATTAIASAFSTVVLEDLNASGMAKNHRLAGSVSDASFREIRRYLGYKVAMRGGRVVIADRWFPSSRTCSACGVIADKMPLSVRAWTCTCCGAAHDRDSNAAKNLEMLVVA
jgi:putative transposase